MPELPEVETVRRGLAPWIQNRVITHVQVRRRDLRIALPDDFEARLTGRRILSLGRRGKYLLVTLDGGCILIVHLGMSGRILAGPVAMEALEAHDHVVFCLGENGAVDGAAAGRFIYRDPRRFGLMALAEEGELFSHPLLAGMGPEPLDGNFTAEALICALEGRKGPIKGVLLNQSVVAGVGNIYACEALFRAGISPSRSARTIRGVRAARLVAALKDVLEEAISSGGSSLKDHRQIDGNLGYFQHSFSVYDRAGQSCPGCTCDLAKSGGVRRAVMAGRSTFFCPSRQR